ncbi:glycosyltransferase family 4 protein [Pseudoclavibacter sp. CFCC 13796]|uniref:glycosyltransferase family 4 protein n=1 Tax=Pseudoclavibacter sp. CFCC 13796 TaxID=2615179 RepID=UPI001787B370|nr:glycosyltransferase family 1 protein [Pseudoclavibacter sp. CFCC 13796]
MEQTMRQPRVVVNCRFMRQDLTGVQRFAENIVERLAAFGLDLTLVAPEGALRKKEIGGVPIRQFGRFQGHLWEHLELGRYVNRHRAILLSLANSAPFLCSKKISTLHDVTYLKYPEGYSLPMRVFLRTFVPHMLKTSLSVLTVSQFSASEIRDRYRVSADKFSVVYNAAAPQFTKGDDPVGKDFLAIYNAGENKNMQVLAEAFAETPDKRLLLVGGNAGDHFHGLANAVFLGRLTDDELVHQYRSAQAVISPSFYEGFGLPVIEAQACGTPVIASDIPVYREVLASSATFFPPTNSRLLMEAVDRVDCMGAAERQEARRVSVKNAQRFSWDESARVVVRAVERIGASLGAKND